MKERINIAEILQNCPKGMELDCTMFDNVTFVRVDMSGTRRFPIEIAVNGIHSKYLTKEGCFHDTTLIPEAKCVIFPKGKTTWEGLQRPFKDGDVLIKEQSGTLCIFKSIQNKRFIDFYCGGSTLENVLIIKKDEYEHFGYISHAKLATEEEKERLFQLIKDNGYKWNAETKSLEKLDKPKFKDGDIVVATDGNPFIYAGEDDKHWHSYCGIFSDTDEMGFGSIYWWCKEVYKLRLATEDEKKKLFAAIKAKGYQWNAETKKLESLIALKIKGGGVTTLASDDETQHKVGSKFDITSLKPFDKVLVRNYTSQKWTAALWSFYNNDEARYPYEVVGDKNYKCAIPYECNEHLLGAKEDCDEYFKTWEE